MTAASNRQATPMSEYGCSLFSFGLSRNISPVRVSTEAEVKLKINSTVSPLITLHQYSVVMQYSSYDSIS